jgi:hypothetical protein
MHYKEIEGVQYFSPGFPRMSRVERRVEGLTQKYLKFFLGAAIVALAWVWSSAFHHTDIRRIVSAAPLPPCNAQFEPQDANRLGQIGSHIWSTI